MSARSTQHRSPARKSNPKQVRITTALPREDLAALDDLARAQGRSRSELIREAVRRTWLNGTPATPAIRPAAISTMSPEELEEWRKRMEAHALGFRTGVMASGISEEELEAEIEAARAEVRADRKRLQEQQALTLVEDANAARGR